MIEYVMRNIVRLKYKDKHTETQKQTHTSWNCTLKGITYIEIEMGDRNSNSQTVIKFNSPTLY